MRLVLDALHVPGGSPSNLQDAVREAIAVVGAERALLALMDMPPEPLRDAISVLEVADADGIPWVALAPGDTPAIEGASAEALTRIGRRLAEGQWVVTPARVPSSGDRRETAWWVVDPATGRIRDEHETGRHMAEYAKTNEPVPSWAERMRDVACRVTRPAIAVASILFAVTSGNPDTAGLAKSIAKAGQTAEENRKRGEEARKIACLGKGGGAGG
jgi:hypothetical protein